MFRRLAATPTAAAVAAATASMIGLAHTQSRRRIFVFSQQNHVLESNQKALGSPSNVWVEEWELERLGCKAEEGALPTLVRVPRQQELYNFDQIISPPEIMEPPRHSNYASRNQYGGDLQFELDDRAQKHNFQSKWWITKVQAYKENLQFKNNARSSIVLMKRDVKLLHTSQIIGGDALVQFPVSGGTRRPYTRNSELFAVLQDHIKSNGFNSGLYFTRRQLENLKLSLQPNAQPVLQEMSFGDRHVIYNVEQLEDPSAVFKALSRSPVNVPTFLFSGEPIHHDAAKKFPKTFKSNYWLTGSDADVYQWPIKESEKRKGVIFQHSGSAPQQIELYNVEQLTNPDEGFAKAGLYTL